MFGGNDGLRRLMEQETSKPKSATATLARFGHYFRPFWFVMAIVAFTVIVSTWTQVITPDLIGQVVDCYLVQTQPDTGNSLPGVSTGFGQAGDTCWLRGTTEPKNLGQWVIKLFLSVPAPGELTAETRLSGMGAAVLVVTVLFVLGSIITGLTFYGMSWAGQHVMRSMRVELMEQLHRLSMSFHTDNEAGDLMSRLTNDIETIQQAINFALVNVLSGILLLVWTAWVMIEKNVPLALLSLVMVPVMAFATAWFSSQARKAYRRTRQQMGSVNAELQESISAVREVQAFNRADENIENFRQTNAANRDANIRAVAFTSALAPALQALGFVALAVVVIGGGLALLGDGTLFGSAISLGLVITFIGYVQRFNQPIQQISILWTNLQSAVAGGERIFTLLDMTPEIVEKDNAPAMAPIQGTVEFKDVHAQYKKGEPVLQGVSFKAEPGQTFAIVGPTGAGKTTIINLIPRFYDASTGQVLVDDQDVRDVDVKSLRSQIGIVLQDTFLFSATVMDNIRFGRPDASDEDVMAAAKLAYADSFIERLPEKYNTVLGERGSGLSQGQRQLLAIARAALADPRILILDEATSSVDTRTERLIQQALNKLLKGRTSFVIAHRLSTIRNADQLLVLDQGAVVERGTHEELLQKKGSYYDLYMSQFWRDEQANLSPNAPKELTPAAL